MPKPSARLLALRILWKGQGKRVLGEDLDTAVFGLVTRMEGDPDAFAAWRTWAFAEAIGANRSDVLDELEWIFGVNDSAE